MKVKVFYLVILVIILGSFISNDDIKVVNFSQFEPLLHVENDTTYIINFWATWCIPCRKELPDFEKFNTVAGNYRSKIYLVSLDMSESIEKTLIPFIEKYKISSEVLILDDPNSNYWINKVDPTWSGTIPATIIFNKNYRGFFPYPLTFENLDSIVKLNFIKS